MPITTSLDEETGLRTYEVKGEMTPADFKGTLAGIFEQPDYVPGSNALWDLREATGSAFSVHEIRGVVEEVLKHRTEDTGSSVALVVASSRDFGLGRMYEQMMAVASPVKIMVFRDRDEAEIWAKGGGEE
ncbi:hypothetical protein KAW64_11065 [bacterium]|nr:hypothetical protein [bacterium]